MRAQALLAGFVLLAAVGCEQPNDNPGTDIGGVDSWDFGWEATPDDGSARDDGTGPGDVAWEDTGGGHWCAEASYIWIANTAEGTVSKLCTLDGVEMGRYWTSPQRSTGDPSRTSVNLHGDAVVTNRNTEGGPSSVTKFIGEISDCVDANGNLRIDTSRGGTDVLPWGEDECMAWNSPLPGTGAIGARATAWDGTEDPATGEGGFVWIGALDTGGVFKLDGDTGEIVAQTRVGNQPYGGVIDGRGHFWIVGAMCTVGSCTLARVHTETLEVTTFRVPCGYGISADGLGRIWTSGRTLTGSCVNRLEPDTGTNTTYTAGGMTNFFRGLAVDGSGSVWVADTGGDVLRIDAGDVTLVHRFHAGPSDVVGVAIDFQGFVWAISQGGNAAIKINPETYETQSFPVGSGPYTYSDMTGYQLRGVIF
jgi:DNA-binding beta-propeller fold protein YncE